jgi:hypothetical protein
LKAKGNRGGNPDKALHKGVEISVRARFKIPSPKWLGIFLSQRILPEPENLRTGSNFSLCSIKTIWQAVEKHLSAALRCILRHCGVRESTPHSSGFARLASKHF